LRFAVHLFSIASFTFLHTFVVSITEVTAPQIEQGALHYKAHNRRKTKIYAQAYIYQEIQHTRQ
jgi:short-subunit dehydrogenase involved in D-alanine esterification of teichoic acids